MKTLRRRYRKKTSAGTRRPASADRTACHHMLPMGVGPFAFSYQGNGATPCQYIDTTRKTVDCATTVLLTVFI